MYIIIHFFPFVKNFSSQNSTLEKKWLLFKAEESSRGDTLYF